MLRKRWDDTWSRWRRPVERGETTQRPLSVGDRFYRTDHGAQIWRIERIYFPFGQQYRHVALSRVDAPAERRLLAEDVLLDRRSFRRDRRQTQIGDPGEYARRRFDRPQGNVRSTV